MAADAPLAPRAPLARGQWKADSRRHIPARISSMDLAPSNSGIPPNTGNPILILRRMLANTQLDGLLGVPATFNSDLPEARTCR